MFYKSVFTYYNLFGALILAVPCQFLNMKLFSWEKPLNSNGAFLPLACRQIIPFLLLWIWRGQGRVLIIRWSPMWHCSWTTWQKEPQRATVLGDPAEQLVWLFSLRWKLWRHGSREREGQHKEGFSHHPIKSGYSQAWLQAIPPLTEFWLKKIKPVNSVLFLRHSYAQCSSSPWFLTHPWLCFCYVCNPALLQFFLTSMSTIGMK